MWNPLATKKTTAASAETPAISLDQLIGLAIEHWRLNTALARTNPPAPARHALRKIGDLLKSLGIEAQSLDQMPHDPGMSVQVIDRVIDPDIAPGREMIVETISPLITMRGRVLKHAEVVVGAAS